MGYFLNNKIAKVDGLQELTLSGCPNFVKFSNLTDSQWSPQTVGYFSVEKTSVSGSEITENMEADLQKRTRIEIWIPSTQSTISIKGTYRTDKVDNKTFRVLTTWMLVNGRLLKDSEALAMTAQNIKECLLKDPFFRNNFEINIYPSLHNETLTDSNRINLKALGYGDQYNFDVKTYDAPQGQSRFISYRYLTRSSRALNSPKIELSIVGSNYSDQELGIADEYSDSHAGLAILINGAPNSNNNPIMAMVRGVPASKGAVEKDEYVVVHPSESMTLSEANIFNAQSIYNVLKSYDSLNNALKMSLVQNTIVFEENYQKKDYDSMQLVVSDGEPVFFDLSEVSGSDTSSGDTMGTISGETSIELDVYSNLNRSLGDVDEPQDYPGFGGSYLASLSKSYFGKPVWFDMNALIDKTKKYSTDFLTELDRENAPEWVDTGTSSNYYFVAKRKSNEVIESFFISDIFYFVNGYDYTLNQKHLDDYLLDFNQDFYQREFKSARPLSSCLDRTHIAGQKQFFNFVLKYPVNHARLRPLPPPKDPRIGLRYRVYTHSGEFIGQETSRGMECFDMQTMNTALLKLDRYLPQYKGKTVGLIKVNLVTWHEGDPYSDSKPEMIVSDAMTFRILPDCLNTVNDFVFLNRLGGWDTFNFGGTVSHEFKTTGSTFYQTLQPGFGSHTQIESSSFRTVEEQFKAQSSPIDYGTVEWLREMSASTAVYELATKRYVLIDDMTLKYSSADDLYQIEMKYHYSDTFNTRIK